MNDKKHYAGGESSIWIQPNGPGTQMYFLGCHGIEGIDEPLGDYAPFFCPNPAKPNSWVVSGGTVQPADAVEMQIESDVTDNLNLLETLECPYSIYVNQLPCGRRDVFANYERTYILNVRKTESRQYQSVALREANDRTVVTHNLLAAPPLIKTAKLNAMEKELPSRTASGFGVFAATNEGLYLSDPFIAAAGIQTTWNFVGQALEIGRLAVNPDDPAALQLALVGSGVDSSLWMRRPEVTGDDWVELITIAEALTLAGSAPTGSERLIAPWYDPLNEIVFCTFRSSGTFGKWILRSYDFGVSWTVLNPDITYAIAQIVTDTCGIVYLSLSDGGGAKGRIWRSTDSGDSWTRVFNGEAGGWHPIMFIDRTTDILYAGARDPASTAGTIYRLISSAASYEYIDTVENPAGAISVTGGDIFAIGDVIRTIRDNNLYISDDGGSTWSSQVISEFANGKALSSNSNAQTILARDGGATDLDPHNVFLTIDGVTLLEKSGPNADQLDGGGDSIPYTATVAFSGIKII